jgi:hypothetical protein
LLAVLNFAFRITAFRPCAALARCARAKLKLNLKGVLRFFRSACADRFPLRTSNRCLIFKVQSRPLPPPPVSRPAALAPSFPDKPAAVFSQPLSVRS